MSGEPVIELRRITVAYPGQLALDDVDLTLRRGEVHSVVGENGAGKSTLVRVLSGAIVPDHGAVIVDGSERMLTAPARAQAAGIQTVHQDVGLLPNLTVAENVMLGDERRNLFGIDRRQTRDAAEQALAILGLDIDPMALLSTLSPATRRLVAVARAVRAAPAVLVLDEPTASLGDRDAARLFDVLRRLRSTGTAILFVSHLLEQVYDIADRITVLRGGVLVGEFPTSDVLRRDIVGDMLGSDPRRFEEVTGRSRAEPTPGTRALLTADRVVVPALAEPLDLVVGEGEVLGIAGLLGSGRTSVARALAGVDPVLSGRVTGGIDSVPLRSPRAALAARVVYASEDRLAEGVVAELTVRENILLSLQAQRGLRRLSPSREDELVRSWIDDLNITPRDPDALVGTLSGGNQQKVLLARWLAIAPRVIVMDEPTRGIDIGTKVEIQHLVASLAENGVSVVYVSTEMDEVLRLSDRVLVLREGSVVGIYPREELDRDTLLALISEGPDDHGEE